MLREAAEPGSAPLDVPHARHEELEPVTPPPAFGDAGVVGLCLLVGPLAPRPLGVPALAHLCALENEPDGPLRMGRGEEHRERSALRLAHDRGTLAPDRVHDGADVVHALLERRRARDAVGHPEPALVEPDQTCELREALAPAAVLRKLPRDLQVRERTLDVHEVDRAVPDHVVRDVDAAAPHESDVRHTGRFPPRGLIVKLSAGRRSAAAGATPRPSRSRPPSWPAARGARARRRGRSGCPRSARSARARG